MKNKLLVGILIFAIVLIPIILMCFAFGLPSQYDLSFYAGMKIKYDRLNNVYGRKIVVIGGSSVAFGVCSDILELETGIPTVNFGLYANLGTKYMLDVAEKSIRNDDIVIIAPELNSQALSNYFNGEAVWYSVDGNYEILKRIDTKNIKDLASGFLKFTSNKFGFWQKGEKPYPDGIYNVNAFDEYGDIKYDRPYNIMPNGYDAGMLISFEKDIIDKDFVEYLNSYANKLQKKGAQVFYSFCPMNKGALAEGTSYEKIVEFYDYISENLKFDILGNPINRIMDSGWFYDSNFHLNNNGSIYYTAKLAQDIKAAIGDYSSITTEIPDMPQKPSDDNTSTGGGIKELEDVAKIFNLSNVEIVLEGGEVKYKGNWIVEGLTEYGLTLDEIIIPDKILGLPVTTIKAKCFEGNKNIKKITLGANISSVENEAFRGCDNLTGIYISSHDPNVFHPYIDLLDGLDNCYFYIHKEDYSKFMGDYFWGYIGSDRVKTY